MYSAGRRRTIVVLFITSLILITLDSRQNAALDAARSGFGQVLRPFNAAGEVVSRPIQKAWTGIVEADDLRQENAELRAQIDNSSADLIAAENAIIQAQELKELVDLEQLADIPKVTGNIIGDSPSNFDQRVELGIGTNKGVRIGMPVVSGGLVGKVHDVDAESCVVMLMSDPQYTVRVKIVAAAESDDAEPADTTPSGIPTDEVADIAAAATTTTTTTLAPDEGGVTEGGTTTTTTVPETTTTTVAGDTPTTVSTTTTTSSTVPALRETGSLTGKGADRLPAVTFVYESKRFGEIKVGDLVYTTGGRLSNAPPDIPVGEVVNIIRDGGVDGLQIEVQPSTDLDQLNFLTVLLYQSPAELGSAP